MKKNVSTFPYKGYRFPPEIISHCVWLYFRFSLSFRDIEEIMAEREVVLTYETIRDQYPSYASASISRSFLLQGAWYIIDSSETFHKPSRDIDLSDPLHRAQVFMTIELAHQALKRAYESAFLLQQRP